jgi:O-antigen/teichoic acid export membrane protein
MKDFFREMRLLVNGKILKNTLILFTSGFVTQIGTFFVMIFIARKLGPESFGQITFASTLVSYFLLFGGFGLTLFGTKKVSRSFANIPKIITTVIFLRIIASVFSLMLLCFGLWLFGVQKEKLILVLIYSIEIVLSVFLLDWVFQGREKMLYVGYSRIISVVVMALVLRYVDVFKNIYWVPIAQVIGVLFSVTYLLLNINKTGCIFKIRFSKASIFEALHEGGAILITTFFNLIMFNSGILLLGFYSTDTAVGQYGAFYKIAMLVINFSGAYYNAIFPVAANYYKTSLESLIYLKGVSIQLSFFVAVPVAIAMLMFPAEIISLFFGSSFISESLPFQLMGFVVLLNLINTPFGRGLIVTDRQNILLKIMIISSLSNILFAIILIPKLGLLGAVFGLLIGELVALPLQFRAFKDFVNLKWVNIFMLSVCASALLIITTVFLHIIFKFNWIFSFSIGCIVYATTIFYFGDFANKLTHIKKKL